MEKRVLVVDDDRLIREMTRDALALEGFRVHMASSGSEALEWVAEEGAVDVLLTDLSMREMDGFELMERIKRDHPGTDVIVLTAYASLETALQALRLGAADYLRKPISPPEIAYCVKRTLLRRRLTAENEALRACVQAFEASRTLTSCLETTDILPLCLDILLRVLARSRAIGRVYQDATRTGDGVYLRGFEDDAAQALRTAIEREKVFDLAELDAPAPDAPGRRAQVLGTLGLDEEPLLQLPLRQDGRIVGGVWLFGGERGFTPDEVRRAELVANQAELAIVNAERFVQAREKAFVDDVTGLYNARYLLAAIDRELSRAARARRDLSLLFLDLDRFKTVNDRFGHLVGSQVLRELGQLLQDLVRAIDTVGRYGGDEFTILLVDTPHSGAVQVAERIRETVESTPFGGDRGLQLSLTISVGVANFPTHGNVSERILDRADKAMYLAKALGRNRVCSADELTESSGDPS